MLQPDEIPLDHILLTDVCIHNPGNINNCERVTEEAYYSMVLLLHQYAHVLVNVCNLE
jgi:hypothetical protein